jgi:hypothetical protein
LIILTVKELRCSRISLPTKQYSFFQAIDNNVAMIFDTLKTNVLIKFYTSVKLIYFFEVDLRTCSFILTVLNFDFVLFSLDNGPYSTSNTKFELDKWKSLRSWCLGKINLVMSDTFYLFKIWIFRLEACRSRTIKFSC